VYTAQGCSEEHRHLSEHFLWLIFAKVLGCGTNKNLTSVGSEKEREGMINYTC
jgi:hypothetical protein